MPDKSDEVGERRGDWSRRLSTSANSDGILLGILGATIIATGVAALGLELKWTLTGIILTIFVVPIGGWLGDRRSKSQEFVDGNFLWPFIRYLCVVSIFVMAGFVLHRVITVGGANTSGTTLSTEAKASAGDIAKRNCEMAAGFLREAENLKLDLIANLESAKKSSNAANTRNVIGKCRLETRINALDQRLTKASLDLGVANRLEPPAVTSDLSSLLRPPPASTEQPPTSAPPRAADPTPGGGPQTRPQADGTADRNQPAPPTVAQPPAKPSGDLGQNPSKPSQQARNNGAIAQLLRFVAGLLGTKTSIEEDVVKAWTATNQTSAAGIYRGLLAQVTDDSDRQLARIALQKAISLKFEADSQSRDLQLKAFDAALPGTSKPLANEICDAIRSDGNQYQQYRGKAEIYASQINACLIAAAPNNDPELQGWLTRLKEIRE